MCTLVMFLIVVLLAAACFAISVEIPIATEPVYNDDSDNITSTANITDNVTKTTENNYDPVTGTGSTTASKNNGPITTASKNQILAYTTANIVSATNKINKSNNKNNSVDSKPIDKVYVNDHNKTEKNNAKTVNYSDNINVLPVNDYKQENNTEKVNSDAVNLYVKGKKKESRKITANIATSTITACSTTINDKMNAENNTEKVKSDDNSNKTEENRESTTNIATSTVTTRSTTLKRTTYSTTTIKTTYTPITFVNSTYLEVTRSTDANTNSGTGDSDTGINSVTTIGEELDELEDFEDENNK